MLSRPSSIQFWSVPSFAALLATLISCCLTGAIQAQSATAEVGISRWLEGETIGVVRCDIERLSQSLSSDHLQDMIDRVGLDASMREAAQAIEQHARRLLNEFREAGGREVWILLNPIDLACGSPLIIVRGTSDGDADRLRSWLEEQGNSALQVAPQDATTSMIGHPSVLERVAQMQPRDRPELTEALMTDTLPPVVAVLALGPDQRRVLRETFPPLPEPWGEVSGEFLADGIRWSRLHLDPSAEIPLKIMIQTRDSATAAQSLKNLQRGIQCVTQWDAVAKRVPQIALLPELLPLRVVGDQVIMELPVQALETFFVRLFAKPVWEVRRSAQRMQCMNNFKQIGVAMHTYHSERNTLPPAASVDPSGEPLLSWRVHLLPYLGEKALYDQFHLDEAWNSEHNQKLIPKIPAVFSCPASPSRQDGTTSYLLPIGPGTVWGGERPLSIREIRDGTSNTVMVVESTPEKAVVWTKPGDLVLQPDAPGQGLGRQHGEGHLALYCDGSVRLLSGDLPAESLWLRLDANDGQVVRD